MTTQSARFTTSPSAMLDIARNLFVSENFVGAVELLNETFEGLEQENAIALLKGTLDIDSELNLVEGKDEEHILLVAEIMENYDFLYPMGEGKFLQGVDIYEFTAWNENNDFEAFLMKNTGKVIPSSQLPRSISSTFSMISIDTRGSIASRIVNAEAFVYLNDRVMIMEVYSKPFYSQFCQSYQDLSTLMDCLEASHQ